MGGCDDIPFGTAGLAGTKQALPYKSLYLQTMDLLGPGQQMIILCSPRGVSEAV